MFRGPWFKTLWVPLHIIPLPLGSCNSLRTDQVLHMGPPPNMCTLPSDAAVHREL